MNAPSPVWLRSFGRRAGDDLPAAELPKGVAIGSKWQPSHKIVRDPDSGFYFERNPPMETSAELDVQRALLSQRENNRARYWLLAVCVLAYLAWAVIGHPSK